MDIRNKSITELHDLLINKKISDEELIKECQKNEKNCQDECNAFDYIIPDVKENPITNNLLAGIPYGIKANYATKGILSTGSSNTLNNYVPIFDATVITKLKKAGAIALDKTAMDEFGMGGTGTTARTGIIKNPWDNKRMCAGSSAGSAAAVSYGVYPFALGSDTGDSIRKPAAYCGIVGYKPTYGMISRYGLFPFASSLDHCGVLTRNVKDAAIVTNAIKGKDANDLTTWDSSNIDLLKNLTNKITNKKLCYIKEITDINNYPNASKELTEHLNNFNKVITMLKEQGVNVDEVSVDKTLLNTVASVYVILSCAEATSNMANLTGISFGPRGKGTNVFAMMQDHRTNGFSPLIKRRFIIGSYVLQRENQERYFKNAQKIRRLIVDEWQKLLKEYDAIILPVSSGPAKLLNGEKDTLAEGTSILEEHLQIGNFGGFPSITIPDGLINNLPVGLNITGKCYDDANILNIAYQIEALMPYHNQIAKKVQ
jgi:aspartyl-tRNA(Asn)/glutamyl-tRNA(Gln) amidotransferase subunit A